MTATHIPPAATPLDHTQAYLALTNTDPMTRLPLLSSDGAYDLLGRAGREGTASTTGYLSRKVTVTCAGVHYHIHAS
jgi:hypothetical protein